MSTEQAVAVRLNELLASAGLPELPPDVARGFQAYFELLVRWNARLNLTAIRNEEDILSRHFVESIACARAVPDSVRTLLDFGSGAGFPGIPIALCRPEIGVTLAESQGKKAAFLREAVRTLGVSAKVFGGRVETVGAVFDCVAMRAVERMEKAVGAAAGLVRSGGCLVLMTTESDLPVLQRAAGGAFEWRMVPLTMSESRLIALGRRLG